ncbi:hypothetical protein Tco_0262472, partial [Tanacetum coccineum]
MIVGRGSEWRDRGEGRGGTRLRMRGGDVICELMRGDEIGIDGLGEGRGSGEEECWGDERRGGVRWREELRIGWGEEKRVKGRECRVRGREGILNFGGEARSAGDFSVEGSLCGKRIDLRRRMRGKISGEGSEILRREFEDELGGLRSREIVGEG